MSVEHEVAVPRLHARTHELRRELASMRELAERLAEALDAEVDLQHGARDDAHYVKRRVAAALHAARVEGLL